MSRHIQSISETASGILVNPVTTIATTAGLVGAEVSASAYVAEHGVGDPAFAYAAGALAVVLTLADRYKQHTETHPIRSPKLQTLELSDPDFVRLGTKQTRRVSRFDRVGHVAAIGLVFFGGLQLAKPESTTTRKASVADLVINATDYQNAGGMNDGNSRLLDSVDGALLSAENANVPYSFILDGTSDDLVGNTQSGGGNVKQVASTITGVLKNPGFQNASNSQSFSSGLGEAENEASGAVNRVLIIDSSLDSSEQSALSAVRQQKRNTTQFYGIVVGTGSASSEIGNQSLTSSADPTGFIDVLGQKNVKTANSEKQVADDINAFNAEAKVKKEVHVTEWPAEAAVGFGALASALAIRRRLSGSAKQFIARRRNHKGDKS